MEDSPVGIFGLGPETFEMFWMKVPSYNSKKLSQTRTTRSRSLAGPPAFPAPLAPRRQGKKRLPSMTAGSESLVFGVESFDLECPGAGNLPRWNIFPSTGSKTLTSQTAGSETLVSGSRDPADLFFETFGSDLWK